MPVDGALLDRGERLAPTHGNGVGVEGVPEFEVDLAARHSNLESGDILGRANRVLAVRHLTEAVVRRRQIRDALRGKNFFVVLAAGGVDDAPRVLIVVKRPRHRADQQMLVEHRHHARRIRRQVDRAIGYHLDALRRVAARQLIVRKYVDDDVAVRLLRHQLRESIGDLGVGGNVGAVDRHHEFDALIFAFFAFALLLILAAAAKHKAETY